MVHGGAPDTRHLSGVISFLCIGFLTRCVFPQAAWHPTAVPHGYLKHQAQAFIQPRVWPKSRPQRVLSQAHSSWGVQLVPTRSNSTARKRRVSSPKAMDDAPGVPSGVLVSACAETPPPGICPGLRRAVALGQAGAAAGVPERGREQRASFVGLTGCDGGTAIRDREARFSSPQNHRRLS